MFKYTKEELEQLKFHNDSINKIEENIFSQLDSTLLESLLKRINFLSDIDDIFDEPYIQICGCLGPKYNEPYCGCHMRTLLYNYRYDIALEYLKRSNLINTLY